MKGGKKGISFEVNEIMLLIVSIAFLMIVFFFARSQGLVFPGGG
jgi:hypothetical protein